MNYPRLIIAPLKIEFCLFEDQNDILREFDLLSESDEDPVGQWLKIAKARGETSDSDQVLLTLLVELHRKIDELSAYVKNEKKALLDLEKKADIVSIGYEHFLVEDKIFEKDKKYYGRVNMPVFPRRQIPLFFVGVSEELALIKHLHDRDKRDWDSYFTARERVMIRELKANK